MTRFGRSRRTWASDHERARQRAAERLSLPLPAAEDAWLVAHLSGCPACARVAAQYEAHRERLRRMRPIEPPRDLWARTRAALDRAEHELAGRELPTSAARRPGGGPRAVRSIRSLRAERHASALGRLAVSERGRWVDVRRGRAARHGNPQWAFPFATLAAFTLVVATAGMILNGVPGTVGPLPRGSAAVPASSGPGATPITITTARVAWLAPNVSGGYSLTMASVDQVCPDDARHDCAPIEGVEEQALPSFSAQPAAVVRSPANGQLVVVDRSAKSRGGSVYVIAMPAAVATPDASRMPPATAEATAEPTTEPTTEPSEPPASSELLGASDPPATSDPPASDGATPLPGGDPTPEPVPTALGPTPAVTDDPGRTTEPSPVATVLASIAPSPDPNSPEPSAASDPSPEPGASEPAPRPSDEPSGDPTAEPSTDPAASPDPSFSSQPASPEPSMAAAIAIISNVVLVGESASYSADGSMFAFSARPADGSHGPDIYLWRVGDAQARAITSDHGSIFSGWAGNLIIGSRAVAEAAAMPSPSPLPAATEPSPAPGDDGPGTGDGAGDDPAEPTPIDASGFGAVGASVSGGAPGGFAAQAAVVLAGGIRETGAIRGRLTPASVAVGPSSSPAQSGEPTPGPVDGMGVPLASPGSAIADPPADPSSAPPAVAPSAAGADAVPVSFLIDPATGVESLLSSTPTWRPVVDPAGRLVVYWSGTLRYDPVTRCWLPDAGRLYLAPWDAFASPGAVEVPVAPLFEDAADAVPTTDWEAQWDDDGEHLAIWRADAEDPGIGRLSLLAMDPAAGALNVPRALLRDEPALPGFSIAGDHLAWATPPGQNGEGSRIQVLAWSGEHAGQIVSQPTGTGDAIIVVR